MGPPIERLLALPTYTKILIANSLIIAFGALFGTSLVSLLEDQAEVLGLAVFVAVGIGASVLINSIVVRAALRPMTSLARTARSVRLGEESLVFAPPASADADTRQLADALSAMLSRLAQDATALDASRYQLRALASRILGAQEDERRRIARELHDETAQVLATLLIQVSLLREQMRPARTTIPPAVEGHLSAIESLAQAALESVRAIAYDLRPSVLDDLGLAPAIRWYATHRICPAGLDVAVEAESLRLAPETETALYRVAQEALTNVLKHARATRATVHLAFHDDWVELIVTDDGQGFVVDEVMADGSRDRRLGLLGMQERVQLLGGSLVVRSQPGAGTHLVARLPASVTTAPAMEPVR